MFSDYYFFVLFLLQFRIDGVPHQNEIFLSFESTRRYLTLHQNMSCASVFLITFLLTLPSMQECCVKLTTMDATRKTLKLTNIQSESNVTLEMNPFLIRTENGNIALTLSEDLNNTNSRCYQIFIKDVDRDGIPTGCLVLSSYWRDSRGSKCEKEFLMADDDVDYIILIRIYSGGVIELKINNKTRFIYKDRQTPIDVKYISVASTRTDNYNEFYFNCYDERTNTIKYL
ncbi:hypothetical protein Bhyg_10751 [Pseudolycoriella hygida]|uniref:Uncharacterized protein n=1 Tax=Pseudolycoriella hygida TaxID=35572 RepID=A0A9Q0MU73_9DIPT|nr:hypothetical protein Bhyg_10751 [Pseudolycoriella hygida]